MKIKTSMLPLMALVMLLLAVGCKEPGPEKKTTTISLNKKEIVVFLGKTNKIKATLDPKDAQDKITWETSDATIATVNNGTVKGVKEGEATITAKLDNGNSATCKVTVKKKGDKEHEKTKTKITLDKETAILEVGKLLALRATLDPRTATDLITWESSDAEIAKVNEVGAVTGVKKGKATITAKLDNGNSATCAVTVVEGGQSPSGDPISFKINPLEMEQGSTVDLKEIIQLNPALPAGEFLRIKEMEQSTPDNSWRPILTITERDWTIFAHGTGTAQVDITRSDTKATARLIVEVKEKSFRLPEGSKLIVTGGRGSKAVEGVKTIEMNAYGDFYLSHKVVDKDGKEVPNVLVTRKWDENLIVVDMTDDTHFNANQDNEQDFETEIEFSIKGTELKETVKVIGKNSIPYGTVNYKK